MAYLRDDVPDFVLYASDNKRFTASKETIFQSPVLKTMAEALDDNTTHITVPDITGDILDRVLSWCYHHKERVSARCEDRVTYRAIILESWEKKFFDVHQIIVFELLIAANELNIESLLNAGCKSVADKIRGKSPEEIRATFGIVNDFTPEEEAAIQKEYQWANCRF